MMGRKKKKPQLKEILPKLSYIYGYFWPQIRAYRGQIVGSLIAMIAGVAFRLLEPWPIKIFLDYVLGGNKGPENWFTQFESEKLLLAVAVAAVVVAVGRAYTDYVSRVGFFVVGNKVVIKVRNQLYRHLQRLSLGFHSRSRTGDLIVRVTRDVSLLRDVTATAMLPLIASVTVLLGMVIVMLVINWKLTLLSLTTLPLFWFTTVRLGKRIRESARKQRAREGAMATTAAEALGAIRVIKAMGLEERFAQSFSQKNSQSQKEDLKASRLSVRLGRTIDVLLAISSAVVLWFGGKLVLAGSMSPGDIIVFLTYLKRSFKPAQEFAKYVARLAKAAASGERVIELLEMKPAVEDVIGAEEIQINSASIQFDDVTFGYEDAGPVLDRLSFRVEPGECVSLVGPSGGGKTTVLSLALRLFEPHDGAIQIDGQPLPAFKLSSLRGQTSSVMQDPLLLADTIFENIACAKPGATQSEVIAAAQLAQAHEFIEKIPGGYQATIGERGATLSRGQQQRIAIARAAIRQSPILLLDEPTTGLDEESEQLVLKALMQLAKGRTTLLVTHNLSLAAQADRILFVDAGRIAEQGTHTELLAKRARYANWFTQQQTRNQRDGGSQFSIVS